MSFKQIVVPNVGPIKIYRRKGAKSMRLSINADGAVRLTMPKWAPYSSGILFINKQLSWLENHKVDNTQLFKDGARVGKAHTLNFRTSSSSRITKKITGTEVNVYIPDSTKVESNEAQSAARQAILKALKLEAEILLPKELDRLASEYGFSYSQIKIKQLKSRWGSCNNLNQINLSFYLIQLPWELIDYVILHELTHTKILAHGPKFWEELQKYLPNAKTLRKQINMYKPVIIPA